MINVLIADDHALLRKGLKEILVRELGVAVCGEAEDAHQVLLQVPKTHWDLVILDFSMPGPSAFDVLKDIKGIRPKLPVLVLSMYPEHQYGKRVLQEGASGYVNKATAPQELITAVRKVLGGGRYVSPMLAESLAWDLGEVGLRPAHKSLSNREFEVLRMIAAGETVLQIATKLRLSPATVRSFRSTMLEKMKLTTTAQIIRYVFDNHLFD